MLDIYAVCEFILHPSDVQLLAKISIFIFIFMLAIVYYTTKYSWF